MAAPIGGMKVVFSTKVAVCSITALCINNELILAGEGSSLNSYGLTTGTPLDSLKVLKAANIYGIKPGKRFLCVYGQKCIGIVESACADVNSRWRKVGSDYEFEDWILDVCWLNDQECCGELAVALAHNVVLHWDCLSETILTRVYCEENCILYSAKLVGHCWTDLVVAAGTVYNEVLLWNTRVTGGERKNSVMHRLTGHKGVIFDIDVSVATSRLCSVSDDRSIRVYTYTGALSRLHDARFHLLGVFYGHRARVWRARLLRHHLVSVGEDAACVVWDYGGRAVQRYEGHRGRCVWSLAINAAETVIVTGGGDACIRRWIVDDAAPSRVKFLSLPPQTEHSDSTAGLETADSDGVTNVRCDIANHTWLNDKFFLRDARKEAAAEEDTEAGREATAVTGRTTAAEKDTEAGREPTAEAGRTPGTEKDTEAGREATAETGRTAVAEEDTEAGRTVAAQSGKEAAPESRRKSRRVDFPRNVALCDARGVLVMMDSGVLYSHDTASATWRVLLRGRNNFGGYSVMASRHHLVLLGDIAGNICLQSAIDADVDVADASAHAGKVLGLTWAGDDTFLSTGPEGDLALWRVCDAGTSLSMRTLRRYVLPRCSQRWVTAGVVQGRLLVCGDRGGTVHAYRVSEPSGVSTVAEDTSECTDWRQPVQSFARVHGKAGVTDVLRSGSDLVLTAGRDGQYRQWKIDGSSRLKLMYSNRGCKGLDWIEKIILAKDDLWICGFHSSNLVVWSTTLACRLLQVPCGGGHRAWDIRFHGNVATFAYIKSGCVCFGESQLRTDFVVKPSLHGREINSLCHLYTLSHRMNDDKMAAGSSQSVSIIATASEDTTINIAAVCSDATSGTRVQVLYRLQNHISNVRTLAVSRPCCPLVASEGGRVMFSGGGRAQMLAWRVTANAGNAASAAPSGDESAMVGLGEVTDTAALCQYMLLGDISLSEKRKANYKPWKEATPSVNPETRFMSLSAGQLCRNGTNNHDHDVIVRHFIGAACSDGLVRLFGFNEEDRGFQLLGYSNFYGCCVLRVTHLRVFERLLLVTSATDGCIAFWDVEKVVVNFMEERCERDDEGTDSTKMFPKQMEAPMFCITSAHQSGVNSICLSSLPDDKLLVASGGDDNSLRLTVLQTARRDAGVTMEIICTHVEASAHAAQITGIKVLPGDVIVTVSIDQRLTVWKFKILDNVAQLKWTSSTFINIADIAEMEAWQTLDGDWLLGLCGVGLQVLQTHNL
ncbi:PREDICTED: WD repeat-containing protein 6-like [Priapulus caudatus]|uniref:tRNA (34-2'-O)-methyltransferase regulator WDR6 n=1 Tax=Priapulus caudatus TaxID=37621 RepID=A0ABM1DQD5_PRICU|nr:PREDICTED: WD repeat-containing protein 6-like [Priapulus caudatus]